MNQSDNKTVSVCEYEQVEKKKKCQTYPGFGVRHKQMLLLFICITTACIALACMSVAILAMTSKDGSGNVATYDWNKFTMGVIMSSYFWGELVTQFPAGIVVCKYGGKPFVTLVMTATGLLSMLVPFAARTGDWMGLCLCRSLQGVVQAFFFPSIHMLLGQWAPISERNRFGNFVYSGEYIGIILALPATGFLSSSSWGWPFVFYSFGGICFLNGIVWYYYGANSPAEHSSISQEERRFIEESLHQHTKAKPRKTPWKAIATSVPVWALLTAQVGAISGYNIMGIETPSYFKLAYGIDIEKSGLYSALPYAVAWLMTIIASFVADAMFNAELLSLKATRQVYNSLGTWGPAIGLLILLFVPDDRFTLALILVIMITGMDGFNSSGYLLNHIDISPNFAGLLVSIGNTMSDLLCLFAPILTGYIVKDPTDVKQWRLVFLLTSAVYFISNLIFIIFVSSERQPWDEELEDEEENNEEMTSLKINLEEMNKNGKNREIDLKE